jgi:hypothetical protein
MRLKQGENQARKAYVMTMLTENPRASYAALQRGLKDRFGHAMQQGLLRGYVEEYTVTLTAPIKVTITEAGDNTDVVIE